MAKQAPIQYTIRGVPPEVDRFLRQKAKRRHKSLNQMVIEELSTSANARTKKADFSALVGKWVPDPAFDEVIASQRKIDPELWK